MRILILKNFQVQAVQNLLIALSEKPYLLSSGCSSGVKTELCIFTLSKFRKGMAKLGFIRVLIVFFVADGLLSQTGGVSFSA